MVECADYSVRGVCVTSIKHGDTLANLKVWAAATTTDSRGARDASGNRGLNSWTYALGGRWLQVDLPGGYTIGASSDAQHHEAT